MSKIDVSLNLEEYSLQDLYNLFQITSLNDDTMKQAKQIVLKMHPDKSRIDSKYFIFFSNAYKRLCNIYEFQNKSSSKKEKKDDYKEKKDDYFDEEKRNTLNTFLSKEQFKDKSQFNKWFNDAFDKHVVTNETKGYGDWLKSNDDYITIDESISKTNMNQVFEQKKKQIQTLIPYKGVSDMYSSSFAGASLDNDEDISSNEFYTDLKEAYTNTLIPVTEDDYNKMPKFKNVTEYNMYRQQNMANPYSKEEAEKILYQQKESHDKTSAALAFKYAEENEKIKQKQKHFWTELQQIAFW